MDSSASPTPQIHGLEHTGRRRSRHSARSAGTFGDRWELFSGVLLCILTLITPWLYGTTEDWSIHLMTAGSFLATFCVLPLSFRGSDVTGPSEYGREKLL